MGAGYTGTGGFHDNENNLKAVSGKRRWKRMEIRKTRILLLFLLLFSF